MCTVRAPNFTCHIQKYQYPDKQHAKVPTCKFGWGLGALVCEFDSEIFAFDECGPSTSTP